MDRPPPREAPPPRHRDAESARRVYALRVRVLGQRQTSVHPPSAAAAQVYGERTASVTSTRAFRAPLRGWSVTPFDATVADAVVGAGGARRYGAQLENDGLDYSAQGVYGLFDRAHDPALRRARRHQPQFARVGVWRSVHQHLRHKQSSPASCSATDQSLPLAATASSMPRRRPRRVMAPHEVVVYKWDNAAQAFGRPLAPASARQLVLADGVDRGATSTLTIDRRASTTTYCSSLAFVDRRTDRPPLAASARSGRRLVRHRHRHHRRVHQRRRPPPSPLPTAAVGAAFPAASTAVEQRGRLRCNLLASAVVADCTQLDAPRASAWPSSAPAPAAASPRSRTWHNVVYALASHNAGHVPAVGDDQVGDGVVAAR